MEEADGRGGQERRRQPRTRVAAGKDQAEERQGREAEVAQPVGQHPRLGIGLVEEPEVAEPSQTKPKVPAGLRGQLADRPAEEDSRPLGLGHGAEELSIFRGQGDVVEVARLVPRGPERPVQARESLTSLSPPKRRLDRGPDNLVRPLAQAQLPCQKA